jgi:hypothetical protein
MGIVLFGPAIALEAGTTINICMLPSPVVLAKQFNLGTHICIAFIHLDREFNRILTKQVSKCFFLVQFNNQLAHFTWKVL